MTITKCLSVKVRQAAEHNDVCLRGGPGDRKRKTAEIRPRGSQVGPPCDGMVKGHEGPHAGGEPYIRGSVRYRAHRAAGAHVAIAWMDRDGGIKEVEDVITDPETTHAAWKEFFEVLLNCRRDIPEGVYEDLPLCSNTDPTVEMPPTRKEVSWGLHRDLITNQPGYVVSKGKC
jgi:hypothetical protein